MRAVKHRKHNFQVAVPPELNGGKRERKYFVLRKDAQSFASDLQVAQQHGTRAVSEISPDHVENWAANDKHSPTTRNNRLRTLSSAFSLAVTRRWCESNPVFRVERSNEAKPVAGYLSAAQAKALLDKADADLRPCIAIQLFAGLRPCEMAELPLSRSTWSRTKSGWTRKNTPPATGSST